MILFKALHILSMIAMVAIFLGGEFFYTYAYWQRDVRGLAWIHRAEVRTRLPIFGLLLLLLGIVFGLLTATTGGLDLTKGWLLVAYGLTAAFVVNSAVIGDRMLRLARRALEADAGTRTVDEVVRDMEASRAAAFFFPVNILILAAIILDMVFKPF